MLVHNIHHLVSKVLELPLSVAQRTHISGFQPPGVAVEMIFAVASSPRNSTILISLVGLTHDAQVLDVVLADGAGVHLNIPGLFGFRLACGFTLFTSHSQLF